MCLIRTKQRREGRSFEGDRLDVFEWYVSLCLVLFNMVLWYVSLCLLLFDMVLVCLFRCFCFAS